ncbi:UvrD-helicase domain-containing protein [Rhodococcus sp. WWJCD1]|uniref:UvrD-helicase domain-containing protein n=1 Tax=Rhodococcus sp. WWJCD1 TaxID=2022519 RepID=UPI001140832A|nr:UvrD-helicase domain-containing protein [Rhodococcus sp. WWJCD1]
MRSVVEVQAVASLRTVLVEARALDDRVRRAAVHNGGVASFVTSLTDSAGELAASVTATSDGLLVFRGDVRETEVPPRLPWPLDELIDDSELADWSPDVLVVDLSEVHTYASFYRRDYGLDLDALFGDYRRTWRSWARSQRRIQEGAELYDALVELERSVSTPGDLDTVIAAWRLRVPEFAVDAHIAFRAAQLTRTAGTRPTGELNQDDEFTDTQVPAIALHVDAADILFFEFGSTGITAGDHEPLQVRPSGVEQNDLPIGSRVRDRVLSDIRPTIASAIDRRWGPSTSWTLTMSPALVVAEPVATHYQADVRRLQNAVVDALRPWPDLSESATSGLSDAVAGRWASVVEQRLTSLLARLEGIAESPAPVDQPTASQEAEIGSPVIPKFRDRLRARSHPVDALTRFRDRRRAAAELATLTPVSTSELGTLSLEVDPGANAFELDHLQRRIAEAEPEDRLVVIASAGQGKTEVVAARLDHLARAYDLSLSTEVLVLSFSRAAVSAVRSRLQTRVLAQAEIRTFDSFANRVIIDADEEPKGNFENRIARAVQLLTDGDIELPMLDDIQHVVLDEVQDLVGQRARLALALIDRLGGDVGFTALGDPNQALYDFQLTPEERVQRLDVIHELSRLDDVEATGLQRNFRARGDIPLAVVQLGPRLRTIEEPAAARAEVEKFISGLDPVDSDTWLGDVYRAGKSTAVLTKTNGDALRVSQQLTSINVRHTLRREAQEHGARAWVAELVQQLPRNLNRREDVIAALRNTSVADPTDAWNLLKESEGRARFPNDLDVSRIRKVIGGYGIPTALLADTTEDVVVSTIHRAKGLEFDRVFLYDTKYEPDDDDLAIARRDYVALSRARHEIVRCTPKKTKGRMMRDQSSGKRGRWTEQGFVAAGKMGPRAIEIRVEDIDVDEPFDIDGNAASVQSVLAGGSMSGKTVTLELDLDWTHRDAPIYLVKGPSGAALARTTEQFGREMRRIFTIGGARWPTIIKGATVMSIESVVGSPEISEEAGLGESGIWLVPRLGGLIRPEWKTKWDGKNR